MSQLRSLFGFLFFDVIGSVPRFPVWWYTRGIADLARWSARALAYRWRSYHVAVWVKNFFVPMYGQVDWTSRLISFFMRFFVLLFRVLSFVFIACLHGLGLLAFLVALPLLLVLLFDVWASVPSDLMRVL